MMKLKDIASTRLNPRAVVYYKELTPFLICMSFHNTAEITLKYLDADDRVDDLRRLDKHFNTWCNTMSRG